MRTLVASQWISGLATAAVLTLGLTATAAPQDPSAAAPDTATNSPAPTQEVARYGQPTLYGHDLVPMITFYESLGFEELYRMPEDGEGPPVFATLQNDTFFLALASADELSDATGLEFGPLSGKRRSNDLTVLVEDVDKTWRAAVRAGGRPVLRPKDFWWGERGGFVSDPAGNYVHISTHHE
ncbi:putative glyoxalase superfamily protein PhnB [Actinoalloteichus hoggarensis]|uniref:Glyoxalase-like domain protein n=1 Tax=Actinoalloteichus hoggarensis TaxID=1470176 RepID=A0A221W1U7_9PSEU|nr:VOC family protein [Actinoalloteichus hoggarensis]ASO19726.1 Glyoxalase-like domain protein [Actinoalloteichus hoggarensis]MBB5919568.1 putative glyoxalase superfamily protein PhnB [Actinoalloteichus hoggarensis]